MVDILIQLILVCIINTAFPYLMFINHNEFLISFIQFIVGAYNSFQLVFLAAVGFSVFGDAAFG
jgi:hypothetical protein